jgi:hypothetical protein
MGPEPSCPYAFCLQTFEKGDTLLQVTTVLSDPSSILTSVVVRPGVEQGMEVAETYAHAECVMQAMFGLHSFSMSESPKPVIVDRQPRSQITEEDIEEQLTRGADDR